MTPGASHAAWVAARTPPAPERLLARVQAVLGAHPEWEGATTAQALMRAGEKLLAAVLEERPEPARARALDLLAADACVTWALEAAAEHPARVPAAAQDAMQRLGAVAS